MCCTRACVNVRCHSSSSKRARRVRRSIDTKYADGDTASRAADGEVTLTRPPAPARAPARFRSPPPAPADSEVHVDWGAKSGLEEAELTECRSSVMAIGVPCGGETARASSTPERTLLESLSSSIDSLKLSAFRVLSSGGNSTCSMQSTIINSDIIRTTIILRLLS